MGSGIGLEPRPMYFASSEKPLYCDVSTGTVRPYVTKSFRRQIFNRIHNLSHPGVKTTQKLVTARFVWKSIRRIVHYGVRVAFSARNLKSHVTQSRLLDIFLYLQHVFRLCILM
ncbi:hypothetical protein AVEN_150398-1 [Araneus ventricosus]|uniref:Integrase zinc-binding domain-containing protein n=1 Tax=Araneus ventricosus TaxID=182803 RepID=A0A4Y2AQQ6_ARAVE|nr:hypothetical protein AVEN_150398-1 [Araneus ventricosus]